MTKKPTLSDVEEAIKSQQQLHDAQFSKGGIRYPYSTGNFKGIRKGTICDFGQICGGTKNMLYIRDWKKRNGKAQSKITWLSHRFKSLSRFLPVLKSGVSSG